MQQNSSCYSRPTNIIISSNLNEGFIGLGHELEHKRKQRVLTEQQTKMIENRILYLMKEAEKTNKGIEQKKKYLQEIVDIRKRQEEQRREKQRLRLEREIEIEELKKQSKEFKTENKMLRQQSRNEVLVKNKTDFYAVKSQSQTNSSLLKDQVRKHEESKRSRYQELSVKGHFKSKNLQHMQSYQQRINHEKKITQEKHKYMKELELKQGELIKRLENSQNQDLQLQKALLDAQKVDLTILEKAIVDIWINNKKPLQPKPTKIHEPSHTYSLPRIVKPLDLIKQRGGQSNRIESTVEEQMELGVLENPEQSKLQMKRQKKSKSKTKNGKTRRKLTIL